MFDSLLVLRLQNDETMLDKGFYQLVCCFSIQAEKRAAPDGHT